MKRVSQRSRIIGPLEILVGILAAALPAAASLPEHPLEPPDRSSPRATLTTFLESVDLAWELYSDGDPGFQEPFRKAKESLDLIEVPPLVFEEVSEKRTLVLKEVLDRIELPPWDEVPDGVKVGDFCKFGERRGMVEDVGLRSVKIRTLDRTIVTVPNADFARLQLENLAERDRVLLRENLRLRYETTQEQLKELMSDLESMLRNHDRIAEEPLRVRFTGFGEHYLEVELYGYAMTDAWPEFLQIREDILLKVMEIVENSGTRMALPTEVHYSVRDEERPDRRGTPSEEPA